MSHLPFTRFYHFRGSIAMFRKMKSVFLRKSSRLTVIAIAACCLIFLYIIRIYQEDIRSRSFFPDNDGLSSGLLTCEGFTSNHVLLTTPNKIILYDLKSGNSRLIHEGKGLYYNSFRGGNLKDRETGRCSPTLYVNTREYYGPGEGNVYDKVLKIDMAATKVIESHELPFSRFTHDMIKYGEHVYLADTGHGKIWHLDLPDFTVRDKIDAFSPKDHINNLAVCNDVMLVMLHSRGVSALGVVDMKTGESILLRGVGNQAHQVVVINEKQLLYLDSGLPGLKMFDLTSWKVYTLFEINEEPKRFLKGLFVKSDVAYIGSTAAGSRNWRRDPDNDAELIAFDLTEFRVLWKKKIDSDGILNTISQPFLREDSGFIAMDTENVNPPDSMQVVKELQVEQRTNAHDGSSGDLLNKMKKGLKVPVLDIGGKRGESDDLFIENNVKVKEAGAILKPKMQKKGNLYFYDNSRLDYSEVTSENLVGGEWPSGLKFIDLRWKNMNRKADLSAMVDRAEDVQLIMGNTDGLYLPLKQMILDLKDTDWEYTSQKGNAFLSERDGVMNRFKPGVRDIKFVFSDIEAENSYWFPWYFKFESALRPIIDKVLGPNMTHHIGRMQLARMAHDAEIKPHVDSGGWPSKMHRIHVPVVLPKGTQFQVVGKDGAKDSYQIRLVEGEIFEINNRVLHWVKNPNEQRVHLVIDARERPFEPKWLFPGQTCKYMRNIVCDEATVTEKEAFERYQEAIKS